ncbi:MAG: EAL domain-containing protein [Serpentinimonas sp.]|nr:EAL domain-containing protein [Serpentinimonas sp.]
MPPPQESFLPLADRLRALMPTSRQRWLRLMANARQMWNTLGLAPRMLAVALALLVGMQLVVFLLVTGAITEQAERQVDQELEAAGRVWNSLQARNLQRLNQGVNLLAGDFEFQSAIARRDRRAMESALGERGRQVGARITALLDARLQVLATNQYDELFLLWLRESSYPQMAREQLGAVDTPDDFVQAVQEVATRLRAQDATSAVALIGGAPFQFVLAPAIPSAIGAGWVLMGFPVDQSTVNEMQQLLSVHIALVSSATGAAEDMQLVASTLPGLSRETADRVLARLPEDSAATSASGLLLPAGPTRVRLDGERYEWRLVALAPQNGRAYAVLLRSVTEVTGPFRQLQWSLAGLTLLGLLVFGMASWRAMRQVAQPLTALTTAAQAMERGDFDTPVNTGRRNDELGQLAHSFVHMRSSLQQTQADISRMAFEDALTGLPNRLRFNRAVQASLQQGAHQPAAVLVLNIQRFKRINTVMGYAVGDDLLQAFARRLQEALHEPGDAPTALLARLGADSFGVLLQGRPTPDWAEQLCERIVQAFEAPVRLGEQEIDTPVNVGLACWPQDAPDADALLARAELALQTAKARALRVLRYSSALDVRDEDSLSLLSDLRHALRNHELRLYLQPKLALGCQRIEAAEALLRWQHPQRGLLSPAAFIPFAEQTGFVRELTLWAMREAATASAELRQHGTPVQIAVNLSVRDLLDSAFPGRLLALLEPNGVQPQDFCLEITESAIMDDPQRAEATLRTLARLGFGLSIDDFGTGYSSLAYLRRLPVNELKIDQSFVRDMKHNASDRAIVASTIGLAHHLQLKVVAEGAETDEELALLEAMHCDTAQGYGIARPMPWQELAGFIRQFHEARSAQSAEPNPPPPGV